MRFKVLLIIAVVLILPFLLIFRNPHIYTPVHQVANTVFKPFLVAGHGVTFMVSNVKENAVQFWKTFQEQSEAELKFQDLEGKLSRFRELELENQRLKTLLEFKESAAEGALAARVIAWDLSLLRKAVTLDKGQLNGIKKGMAVAVPAGLIGRVIEVSPQSSKALLLTDPDSRAAGLTQESRTHGIVAGDGSPYLSMKYIDLDSGAQVGETVLSSGVGGVYPKGMMIGKIESLGRDATGLHLQARVNPFVEFKKIEEVLCIAFSHRE